MKSFKVLLIFGCLAGFYFYPSLAFPLEKTALIAEKKCDRCHGFDRDSNKNHAPNLRYAGEKFHRKWLLNFLSVPETIRLTGYSMAPRFLKGITPQTHPSVSKGEAKKLVDYLMTLKSETSEHFFDFEPLSKGEKTRAKIKFERDYGCTSCHQAMNLTGKPRGGVSGPSLVNAGNRLNSDWVYRWLKNPKTYETKSRMPIFKIAEEDVIELVNIILN